MRKKHYFILFCLGFLIGYGITAYQPVDPFPPKKNKILVMISSYKRPLLLSGQIIRFQNQTYDNFDVSVSIKGTSQKFVRQTFEQEWEGFIKTGRLFIRFDKNKNQLTNLLDTVRDLDITKYDYFCKVDDDDWYAPTYLENVNLHLNLEQNISVTRTTNTIWLRDTPNQAAMGYYHGNLSGPTMCFSQKVIEKALEIEKNPAALEPQYSAQQVKILQLINEDRLLNEIAAILGHPQNRATHPSQVVYGQQYPSVIRGGYKN